MSRWKNLLISTRKGKMIASRPRVVYNVLLKKKGSYHIVNFNYECGSSCDKPQAKKESIKDGPKEKHVIYLCSFKARVSCIVCTTSHMKCVD
jgi:hypothetical protein